MKHGSKSQITIHQGLKGRYPTAMGIAHGKIIIVHQDLKGRYPIAMGIAHGIDKSPKKLFTNSAVTKKPVRRRRPVFL